MGWNSEPEKTKKRMNLSSKILIGIIACLVIIIGIFILLINVKKVAFEIYVDGKVINTINKETLITIIDNTTYINIEEFSKLVSYEYHEGEYKSSVVEADKCYVERDMETTSFYLNDNRIYKLLVEKQDSEYEEYTLKNNIKSVNNKMYASIEAISKAFNVAINETTNGIIIYTLDYLVKSYDTNVKKWGYTGIADQSFENQKSLLYGYLIVKKQDGLYKIINLDNTKELALDRFIAIEFLEYMQEFIVTDSLNQVGVIDINGTTKIEPMYESIAVLDKESDLYLIKQKEKMGVITSNNINVIFPEYDSIGWNGDITNTSNNKNLILDTLIPVYKDEKWGAYNKEGKIILDVEYDGFGYTSNSIEIDGTKEVVEPLLSIERCEGVVVNKSEKYRINERNWRRIGTSSS